MYLTSVVAPYRRRPRLFYDWLLYSNINRAAYYWKWASFLWAGPKELKFIYLKINCAKRHKQNLIFSKLIPFFFLSDLYFLLPASASGSGSAWRLMWIKDPDPHDKDTYYPVSITEQLWAGIARPRVRIVVNILSRRISQPNLIWIKALLKYVLRYEFDRNNLEK